MKNTLNEIWKDIDGYPNYQVSNLGRVRNVKTHRILSAGYNKQGYKFVALCKGDGKPKYYLIHRLVAEAFIEVPQSYLDKGFTKETLDIDHVDFDRTNNFSTNLQWLTHKENIQKSNALCVVGYNHEKMIITNQINKLDTYYTDTYQKGFNNGNISHCCSGKYKQAYGLKWNYLNKTLYNLLKKFSTICPNIEVVE